MSYDLVRRSADALVSPPSSLAEARLVRRTSLALSRTEASTLTRLAEVRSSELVRSAEVAAEGLVQQQKIHELDNLAREAMTGQARVCPTSGVTDLA